MLKAIGDLPVIDWACASAKESSFIRAWFKDELIEESYIGPYSPHTWWSGNALLGRRDLKKATIRIEVGPGAVMRIEGDLE